MACLLAALDATVLAKDDGGEVTLAFDLTGPALDEAIATLGQMPLPPYIASRRATDAQDARDYQTMFAEENGAVAAPTAGLHFTPELIAETRNARRHAASAHAACRCRHVPAGQSRKIRAITACMRNGGGFVARRRPMR